MNISVRYSLIYISTFVRLILFKLQLEVMYCHKTRFQLLIAVNSVACSDHGVCRETSQHQSYDKRFEVHHARKSQKISFLI
jgi:hypothetical protein